MAAFAYSAINAQGLELTGELHAPDLDAAKEQLRARGMLPSALSEVKTTKAQGVGAAFRKVKPKSLQVFSRQFATLIESGVSLVQSLVILEEQTTDKNLAPVIADVRADVESGIILSRALARHPRVFNKLYVAMVEAGEASGTLDVVLDRVAVQIEKEAAIKRRVKGAMVYPTMVLSFATLVLIGMLMFLVPIFVKIFDDLGGELPILTQYVLKVSNAFRHPWFSALPVPGVVFILAGAGGAIYGIRRYKRTESGRQLWDRTKLKIPAKIGDVVLKVTMARFSRTLATLIGAGVDIVKALEITGTTAGNWVVESALGDVRAKVHEGIPIAQPLVESDVFPPMVSQMVKIGEETGELEKMLSKIADFYEEEVDASIQALTSIIEPLMMIGVGIVVGIVIISMYMPMFKMLSLVK
jgi:type IV pilus assembly protein PilC